jgi:hypothetical protein
MQRFLVIVPLALAACLSKPDRPTGIDGRIDGDGPMQPDAATPFVVRRDIEVGDINGDGHDDLLRWGNVVEGRQPRVWVYYGSATGLSPTPNLTVDPSFDGTLAWYEVLDVSVDEVDPDVANFEVMVLVAEDRMMPDGDTPQQRALHVDIWSPFTNGTTSPLGRSQTIMNEQIGGLARAPTPAFVTRRHTASGPPEIVFGGLAVTYRLPDLSSSNLGPPEVVRCLDEGSTQLPNIQDLFPAANGSEDNLIAIDHGIAWISDGEAIGSPPPAYNGFDVPLTDSVRRAVRRRRSPADGSQLPGLVVAGGENSPFVQIVEDQGGGFPAAFALSVNPADPVDQVIGNVGGTGQIDVVTLDDNQLRIYKDLTLNGGTATPDMIVAGPNDLVGYNLLAIGNFSDASSGDEIYVLGPAVPPRCYVFTTAIEPC